MKVLHLSGAAKVWGGNENQLAGFIRNAKNRNIENIIFCFTGSPIEKYAIENDVKYISIPKVKTFSLKLARELNTAVKKNAIDIIHIHTSNFVGTFMLADILFKLKVPTVFSKKGISDKSSFFSSIKYNYKGIDKIICVSSKVENAFKKVLNRKNQHKTVLIYDGVEVNDKIASDIPDLINIREGFNVDNKKFIIGNIGNHAEAKDLSTFIKTVNYLVNELNRRDIHFIQFGKLSKYTPEYKEQIQLYSLDKYITFAGYLEGAKHLIPQFDVFLMTSKNEGGPVSMLEAFLMKVPVVITEVGIVPEVIVNGKNGFYSSVGDFKKLAKNIEVLLDNSELRDHFVFEAYEILLQKFTMEVNASKTYGLYKKMLDEKY